MLDRQQDESLFDHTRMTFGQHIEELRKCLLRSIYGLALACIVGFMFADEVVRYLQTPLEQAIREYDLERAKQELISQYGYFDPELDEYLSNRQQVPRSVWVSPDQLAAIIDQDLPAVRGKMLGFEIQTNQLGQLIDKLVHAAEGGAQRVEGKSNPAAALAIWESFSTAEQQQLERLASVKTYTAADRDRVQAMLVRIATESDLYQQPAFDEITTESQPGFWKSLFTNHEVNPYPKVKARIESTGDPLLVLKMNRALIRDTFPDEISQARANLVPLQIWETVKIETQSLTPHEPFMIWMKAGIFAALVIASPWIFYQLWEFVAAGLYPHEKRYVHWYLPISVLLFFAGVSLAFFFVLAPVLDFLFKFNATMGIAPQLRINYWLSFVMYLPIGFGVAFQLPLVMLVLNRLGILSIGMYLSKWRVAIMIIFVISMLLTPADPMSMIMLAVPLTGLYFLGIALCQWMPGNKNPFGEVYEV